MISWIIAFFLGIVFLPVLNYFQRPTEPKIDANLSSLLLRQNHDTKRWEGKVLFRISTLESKKTLLKIDEIEFKFPKFEKKAFNFRAQKYINAESPGSQTDSIIFSLPFNKPLLTKDKQEEFLHVIVSMPIFYPTGKLAKRLVFDTHDVMVQMINYDWPAYKKGTYEYLKRKFDNNRLPSEWKRGEIVFSDRLYDFFYSPPDTEFNLERKCESIIITVPEDKPWGATTFTKDDANRSIPINRIHTVPNPEIEDRFSNLRYYDFRYESIAYRKDRIDVEDHKIRLEERYLNIFFYQPTIYMKN